MMVPTTCMRRPSFVLRSNVSPTPTCRCLAATRPSAISSGPEGSRPLSTSGPSCPFSDRNTISWKGEVARRHRRGSVDRHGVDVRGEVRPLDEGIEASGVDSAALADGHVVVDAPAAPAVDQGPEVVAEGEGAEEQHGDEGEAHEGRHHGAVPTRGLGEGEPHAEAGGDVAQLRGQTIDPGRPPQHRSIDTAGEARHTDHDEGAQREGDGDEEQNGRLEQQPAVGFHELDEAAGEHARREVGDREGDEHPSRERDR